MHETPSRDKSSGFAKSLCLSYSSRISRSTSWLRLIGPARIRFGIRFGRSITAPGANREVWRAQASFNPSDDASLPGDIEFALRYRVLGEDYWDNNESRNYFSNADSGVLLEQDVQLLNIDFNPILQDGQRHYPITVAVRQSLQPKHVFVHWTTDNWRSTQVTPCFFHRMYWDKWHRSSAGAAPGSRIDMMQAFGSASSRSTMHFAFSTRSAVIRRAGRSGTTTLGATTSPATAG